MAFDNTQLDLVIAAKFLAGPAFEQAKAGLDGIRQSQERMAQGMAQANGLFGTMRTAIAAIPFGMMLGQLQNFHTGVVQLAAGITDQSEALGISARQYQALQVAAQNAGIAEAQMTGLVAAFNAKIGEAVQGKKEAIEAFDRLGVKILDSQGKLRAEGAILQEVAQRLLLITDVSTRTAAAKDLLGSAGARVTGVLTQLASGFDAMADKAQRAGLIMDDLSRETLAKLQQQSDASTRSLQVMYAQFAAPIITDAMKELDKFLKTTKQELEGIAQLWRWITGQGGGGGATTAAQWDAANRAVEDARRNLDASQQRQGRFGFDPGDVAGARRALAQAEAELVRLRAVDRGPGVAADDARLRSDGLPATSGGRSNPAVRASGGVGSQRDVLGALEAEGRQLALSYERVMGFSAGTTQEMRDQAELADRIAKRLASALKDVPEGDTAKRNAITAQIEENERYRQSIELRNRDLKEADATERRYGDGLREHTETMAKLNAALADGLISQEAYAGAVQVANDALAQQRERVAQARGGLEGFTAGFASSARTYERANTTFRTGQQLFEGSVNIMSSALENFASTGEFSFKRVADAFASMLLNMAAKQAASGLMDVLGSLFSSAIGGIGGGGGSWGGLSGGVSGGVSGGWGGFYADGGRPPMGRVSLVGERGPELFVPDSSGSIFNQDQLAGIGGEAPVQVTINQVFGPSVNTASRVELMQMEQRIYKNLPAIIVDAKRRRALGNAFV